MWWAPGKMRSSRNSSLVLPLHNRHFFVFCFPSLKDHPLYAAGLKFAHYGRTRPIKPPAHGMAESEVTSHGKETPAAAPMRSGSGRKVYDRSHVLQR
jgi:hypothetical protein